MAKVGVPANGGSKGTPSVSSQPQGAEDGGTSVVSGTVWIDGVDDIDVAQLDEDKVVSARKTGTQTGSPKRGSAIN